MPQALLRGLLLLAIAIVLAATATGALAQTVAASGASPEGLLWHGGRMYFTEMGADRVSIIATSGR